MRIIDRMEKTYRPWEVGQGLLLAPSVSEFVPADHLAYFVRDLVREDLDLGEVYAAYGERRGQPPYHPAMMVALLQYGYARGVYSSRRLERACVERVDFMAVTGQARPDHSTIAEFRKRHRQALARLFVQVLQLCEEAGLVKLGHVALDGTKVKANASKHRAMSYKRMKEQEPVLAAEVERWLDEADRVDAEEDEKYGKDKRGDELPDWVANKKERLKRIREAKARLEAKAKAEAKRVAAEREAKEKAEGKPMTGRKPRALSGVPEDKAQVNFTDPESRILKTRDGYEQGYNCQAGVDGFRQVIVAQKVVAKQNESDELIPLVEQVEENLGTRPKEVSADCGYYSEENLEALERRGVRGYIATGRQKHGTASATSEEKTRQGPWAKAMRRRLKQGGYRSRYRLRKQTVEPVFGQIKEARGFRAFLVRGLEKVRSEWAMICTAHNIGKLWAALGSA
jgi:transposase